MTLLSPPQLPSVLSDPLWLTEFQRFIVQHTSVSAFIPHPWFFKPSVLGLRFPVDGLRFSVLGPRSRKGPPSSSLDQPSSDIGIPPKECPKSVQKRPIEDRALFCLVV